MKFRTYTSIASAAALLLPLIASAQTFSEVLERVSRFLNQIIPFLVLIATVIFIFGVLRYITAGGDEEKVREGRNLIIYGIIGLAVILAVWGLVNIVITFIFANNTPNPIPGASGVPQQL